MGERERVVALIEEWSREIAGSPPPEPGDPWYDQVSRLLDYLEERVDCLDAETE